MDNKQHHNHGLKRQNTTVNSPHHLSFHLPKTSHPKPLSKSGQGERQRYRQQTEKGKGTLGRK